MKSSFEFDGKHLHLKLTTEDKQERAIAALMESYTLVNVHVHHERYSGYGENSIEAVTFTLSKPEKPIGATHDLSDHDSR